METTISIIIRTLVAFLLITQTFISTVALKKSSNVNEFTLENQRTHRTKNYVMKRATDDGTLENGDDFSATYSTDYLDIESNPEELPSMIVDYANMIRNDIILLDNSVETRTRKRGNIKVEKHNPQVIRIDPAQTLIMSSRPIPDTAADLQEISQVRRIYYSAQAFTQTQQATLEAPCSCVQGSRKKEIIDLGEEYFPRIIETKKCSKRLCPPSYSCQQSLYNITILKRTSYPNEASQVDIPHEFRHRWIGVKQPITIGCICTRDYVESN